MDSFPRSFSLFGATAMVAAMLSAAGPAFAADQAATITAPTKASTTHVKRHVPMRMAHPVHAIRPVASDLGCSGPWCGRQFVLMVGIGY
jgi:hypothetical protein